MKKLFLLLLAVIATPIFAQSLTNRVNNQVWRFDENSRSINDGHTYTKVQTRRVFVLDVGSTKVTNDWSQANIFQLGPLTTNYEIRTPDNPVDGQLVLYRIKQATNGTTAFNVTFTNSFKFATSGTTNYITSTTISNMDLVGFQCFIKSNGATTNFNVIGKQMGLPQF